MSSEFHVQYRPAKWAEVLGQAHAVGPIRDALASGRQRAFILTGPSGVGKTTIARLIAKAVKSSPSNILEVDGAANTGVDNARELLDAIKYRPFLSATRTVIVDEAHMLSRAAWNSLLKAVEEPPAGVYWVFCTTEVGKIPATIRTRCFLSELKPVPDREIIQLLINVAKAQGLKTILPRVLDVVVDYAQGSPRQALVSFAQVMKASSGEEAASMLAGVVVQKDAVDLCRALMEGAPWPTVTKIVGKLDGSNPESVRMVVLSYFTKAALGASTAKGAERALAIIQAFSSPYPPGNNLSGVLVSLGGLYL